MIDKNYYKNIIALYESVNEKDQLNEMNEMENAAPVDQSQIADQGSDVMPQGDPNAMPPEAMGDPSMQDPSMMDPNMMGPQEPDSSLVLEKQKFVKLYTLYENLLDYSTTFIETLQTIDTNLLSNERFISMKNYKMNIESLTEKISNYMINIFNNEAYEKVLYAYILFRTELITNIKGLRDILILNKPDEPLPDSLENDKNSKKK